MSTTMSRIRTAVIGLVAVLALALAGAGPAAAAPAASPAHGGEHGGGHGEGHGGHSRGVERFDFGPGRTARGYTQVTAASQYSERAGYGFTDTTGLTQTDRGGRDRVRSDFVTAPDASFVVDLEPGNYTVDIVSGDASGQTDIAVSSEEILKVEETSKGAGEYLETSYDVALIDGQLSLDLAGSAANLNAVTITRQREAGRAATPTVYLTGDSTMQTYDPYWAPQAGWGQVFDQFLTDRIEVSNESIGGRSSRTFLQQGRLDSILLGMHKGDYLFVQFGHNDASITIPDRYTSPEDYQRYLGLYVNGARQRGATPVIVTPVSRFSVNEETGAWNVSFPEYVEAAKQVAEDLDVPLVDLSASSRDYLNGIGVEAAENVFLHADAGIYPNRPGGVKDDTHFQEYGAIQMARLVARDVKGLRLPLSRQVRLHESRDVPAGIDTVSVTSTSTGSAELTWDEASDADVYRIYRSPAGEEDYEFVGATYGTTYRVYGLTEGAAYDVKVSAANESGEGQAGSPVPVTAATAVYHYDFGTASSPVAAGYTQVTPESAYDGAAGYGFTDAPLTAGDDGDAVAIETARDWVASANDPYTFVVDVPDGAYRLDLTIGCATGEARTTVAIEGVAGDEVKVDDGSRQSVEDATVTDGQLTLTIGGASGHLNALTITPID